MSYKKYCDPVAEDGWIQGLKGMKSFTIFQGVLALGPFQQLNTKSNKSKNYIIVTKIISLHKQTNRRDCLKKHEIFHTGEKPYSHMSKMWQAFTFEAAFKNSHWRESIFQLQLWQDIQTKWWFGDAWKLSTQEKSHLQTCSKCDKTLKQLVV